jgi:hypothetical protein
VFEVCLLITACRHYIEAKYFEMGTSISFVILPAEQLEDAARILID